MAQHRHIVTQTRLTPSLWRYITGPVMSHDIRYYTEKVKAIHNTKIYRRALEEVLGYSYI